VRSSGKTLTGTGVLIGHRKNGQFPFPCSWPLCIRSQNLTRRQSHPGPPVFVFCQVLDLPLLMAIRRQWTKPGTNIRALQVTGELTEMNSLMPLILLAGIVVSVIQSVELSSTTPTISISPTMRDTTASTKEPMAKKNGYKKWHGKFRVAPSIIRVSWLLAKTNLKNHDLVASGHSNFRSKESESS
jgi:hypothetical protein